MYWKCDIDIEIVFSLKKEWNSAICNNMDEPWEHYVKWNKPITERYCMIKLLSIWLSSKDVLYKITICTILHT